MNKFKRLLQAAVSSAIVSLAIQSSPAQTTTFSYQGWLNLSGNPANGSYDFIFQVFDAASGGSNIGGLLTTNGVAVSNGLFTVTLDFGGAPFTGPARWLDIAVRTNGAGSYATLNPRQQLTPTPYAIYANTAGTVTNGGIGNTQLTANSVAASNIQNSTITGGKIASGQVVKSLNGLADAVSLTQGANVTITTNGNSLQISAPAGGLALPYSGSASFAGPVFAISNSFYGNWARFGTVDFGVEGIAVSPVDYGVLGRNQPTGNYGALGLGDSGAFGVHAGTGNYGQLGTASQGMSAQAYGSGSDAVFGSHSPSGNVGVLASPTYGTYGAHAATGNSGQLGTVNYGAYGINNAAQNDGRLGDSISGVRGVAAAANSTSAGVRGEHFSSGNYGQLGTANEGVYGKANQHGAYGSLGLVIPGGFPFGIGVYGSDGGNLANLAGSFDGRVSIGGPLEVNSLNIPAASFRRTSSDGVVVEFGGATVVAAGSVSVSGGTATFNAFTGSHYGWTDQNIERGTLVTLTGKNRSATTSPNAEIIYGIAQSSRPNDPRCLGAYLSVQTPGEPASTTNPHLIMAVGNGDMWVTESGAGDLQPGDYLISSAVPGCAMKDDPEKFSTGYICARAAEGVKWSDVKPDHDGVKRVKISVLFESFVRDSRGAHLASAVKAQQRELQSLRAEVKDLRAMHDRVAKLEALLEQKSGTIETVSKKGGVR